MVENREKNSQSKKKSSVNEEARERGEGSPRRQQSDDLVQRRPRLNAEQETRRRNERANELRLKNRSNRMR
jgi:hypothetical protein